MESERLTVEDTTWEVRLLDPEFVDGVVGAGWELERLEGDGVIAYTLELERNGDLIDSFESVPIGTFSQPEPNNNGRLGGKAEPGDDLTLRMVGGGSELLSLSTEVPSDESGDYDFVESPIPVPTWATPFGTPQEVNIPDDVDWTEAVIEDLSASGDPESAEYEFTITVTAEAITGDPKRVERTIELMKLENTAPPSGRRPDSRYLDRTGTVVEETVEVEPGETVEIEGEITDPSLFTDKYLEDDPFLTIGARVKDPEYGRVDVESGSSVSKVGVPDLWKTEPTERPDIPEPHPLPSSLTSNEDTLFDVLAYPPSVHDDRERTYNFDPNDDNETAQGRATHYFVDGRRVSDRNLVDAILAWQAGDIDDGQLSKVHALWEQDEVGVEYYRNKGNTLAAVIEGEGDQTVKIFHNKHTAQDTIQFRGPGVSIDRRVKAGFKGRLSVSSCVPGGVYEVKTPDVDKETPLPFDGYQAPTVEALRYESPDPPEIEHECLRDDVTVEVGEPVTVRVRLTEVNGDLDGEADVTIAVADAEESESVTVPAGGEAEVEAEFEFSDTGEYTPEIDVET